jgi:hypothetical protein
MPTVIRELRIKAARARRLAAEVGDAEVAQRILAYAEELEAQAQTREAILDHLKRKAATAR